jgi:hypothetical protein
VLKRDKEKNIIHLPFPYLSFKEKTIATIGKEKVGA